MLTGFHGLPTGIARIPLLAVPLVFAAVLLGPPATSGATPGSPPERQGIGTSIQNRSLSNEVSVTRFAYARRSAPIRNGPGAKRRTNGRLKFLTSDGQALPYLALSQQTEKPGTSWVRIRLPGRPNGQIGWVRASALGPMRTVYGRLVINRSSLRATLYGRQGQVRWRAPVGVGRPGLATPGGNFWVTERLRAIGGSSYGPFAFGTSAYAPHLTDWPGGGVIGIHGTDEPGLIPGRPSHGCVRVRNRDIRILRRLLEVGTPVRIR